MSRVEHNFPRPERFVIGTVGVPGERQFYLQVREGSRLLSFALEKTQAAALGERAIELLREAGEPIPATESDIAPLDTPIDSEFTIGVMSLTWQVIERLVQFEAQSIGDGATERIFEELIEDDEDAAPPILRVSLTPLQVAQFARRTAQVVSAGRQPCVFCGGPINPGGHLCPRANGHRRSE